MLIFLLDLGERLYFHLEMTQVFTLGQNFSQRTEGSSAPLGQAFFTFAAPTQCLAAWTHWMDDWVGQRSWALP